MKDFNCSYVEKMIGRFYFYAHTSNRTHMPTYFNVLY